MRIASNETAKNVGHVFLLLKWSPGIVRLDWSGWYMSSYSLDMPSFNIVVRQNCNRRRPNTVVGQVRNNWGCEWHGFHHISKSRLTNRRITEPNLVFWSLELRRRLSWTLENWEFLIQDSGNLSNFALLLQGILANSEQQTFSRLIHRCYHAGRLGGFYFPENWGVDWSDSISLILTASFTKIQVVPNNCAGSCVWHSPS